MGVTIGQIVVLILILMFPILLYLGIIAAYIIIDKWVDIIFYPFEILCDKFDEYKRRSW